MHLRATYSTHRVGLPLSLKLLTASHHLRRRDSRRCFCWYCPAHPWGRSSVGSIVRGASLCAIGLKDWITASRMRVRRNTTWRHDRRPCRRRLNRDVLVWPYLIVKLQHWKRRVLMCEVYITQSTGWLKITSIPWAVRLSWLENVYFLAGDLSRKVAKLNYSFCLRSDFISRSMRVRSLGV